MKTQKMYGALAGILLCGMSMLMYAGHQSSEIGPVVSIAKAGDPRPIFNNGRYANPPLCQTSSFGFFDAVKLIFNKIWDVITFKSDCREKMTAWYAPEAYAPSSSTPSVQWLSHATCLIQLNKFNILTDPVFGDVAVVFKCKRSIPAIAVDKLPTIDMILISHNHRDHLDEPSMKKLVDQQPMVLVPEGVEELVKSFGFRRVFAYTWWQKQAFIKRSGERIMCTCVPACHNSGRGFFDHNKALWCGWMIEGYGPTIYFAGDTALAQPLFASIAHAFPSIDIALLPIGPGRPRTCMAKVHCNARDAVEVSDMVHARYMIPIHWGTFCMSCDTFDEELNSLLSLQNQESRNSNIKILKMGQRFALPHF